LSGQLHQEIQIPPNINLSLKELGIQNRIVKS
jgi:hypothetical protein